MTELPQIIHVGDMRYEVLEAERPLDNPGNTMLGEVVFSDLRIYINPNQNAQNLRQTLWHEIVHAILRNAGHDLDDNIEGIVTALGYGLCALVRNNPELIAFTVTKDE